MKKKDTLVKHGSTHFLRVVVFGMGAVALLLCYLILPPIYREWASVFPHVANLKYPLLVLLVATTIPFFIALYQTLKLLNYVDRNEALSDLSVTALKYIKYCSVVFGLLYAAILPFIYLFADLVDAPGVMIIGFIMAFAPLVIAVFAAVLQKLLQSAIDIKNENDLTV